MSGQDRGSCGGKRIPQTGESRRQKRRILKDLHTVIKKGCVNRIRFLLNEGADVNGKSSFGDTPLHTACRRGELDIVRLLLDMGADIDAHNDNGESALYVVPLNEKDNADCVRLLVDRGADVDSTNFLGETVLYNAVFQGRVDIFNALIDLGADVDARTNEGATILHVACSMGRVDMARFLLESGSIDKVHSRDRDKSTPLHVACMEDEIETARLLLDWGAEVDSEDLNGFTPLRWAVTNGNLELTKVLVRRGADISEVSEWEWTMRTYENRNDIFTWLVKAQTFTPLHFACDAGDVDGVMRLLQTDEFDNEIVKDAIRFAASDDVMNLMKVACDPWKFDHVPSRIFPTSFHAFPTSFQRGGEAMREVKIKANSISKDITKFSDERFLEILLSFCDRTWFKPAQT